MEVRLPKCLRYSQDRRSTSFKWAILGYLLFTSMMMLLCMLLDNCRRRFVRWDWAKIVISKQATLMTKAQLYRYYYGGQLINTMLRQCCTTHQGRYYLIYRWMGCLTKPRKPGPHWRRTFFRRFLWGILDRDLTEFYQWTLMRLFK